MKRGQHIDYYSGGVDQPARRRSRARIARYAAASILILLMSVITLVGFNYLNRPKFHNYYGVHPDRGLVPRWWAVPAPAMDEVGNLMLVDKRDNYLVIVDFAGDELVSARLSPGGDYPKYRTKSGAMIQVPAAKDRLIMLSAQGVVGSVHLKPGEASVLFESQADVPSADFASEGRKLLKQKRQAEPVDSRTE